MHCTEKTPLRELAGLFLKLGTIAFGGPAAHIAMMEDEVVRRRKWFTREQFLDYLGAANLIPGPNSTELAIHIGRSRAGWPGLVVAGTCFIIPAMLMVGAIAWAYVRYGSLPETAALLYGVKPVVIAVILQALWGLGRTALKSAALWIFGAAAATAILLGINELLVLLLAGVLMALSTVARGPRNSTLVLVWPGIVFGSVPTFASVPPVHLSTLFGLFVKTGSVLFGSGYVLLAFLRADFVERLGWLTEQQLLDAIAVGQITPGPVFTTATFVGYILAGTSGALVATAGIFLPAFVFVAASAPLIPKLRRSPVAGAVLDGVNVASLALMAVVTIQLAHTTLIDPITIALAAASAFLLFRFRINSAWLVLAGAIAGLLLY